MKALKYSIFIVLCSILLAASASSQSRTNRLTRPCPGSTTPATVAISVDGTITATPCSGKQSLANVLTSYLTTTVTYNNNAVLADTALSVNVAASGIYDIDLVIQSGSGVGAYLLVDFGGTATVTNFIGQWIGIQSSDPLSGNIGARSTAAGTDFPASGIENQNVIYTFRGTVEINAAGTFLIRGSQNGATAVNTTIIRGSTLKLTKLN